MSRCKCLLLFVLLIFLQPPVSALDGGVESLRETGKAFAAVAREVSPSVVFIQVESHQPTGGQQAFGGESPFGDDFLRRFFGDQYPNMPRRGAPQDSPPSIGQGSGFVFAGAPGLASDTTYILTNHHVVENADRITVRFQDGREFQAQVKGADPQADVAVLEIKQGGLPALPLADSAKLEVGEWVVAIGNPFGLSHSLTVGVVSAKGRTSLGIEDYEDFIQTDAAINPGNSGGPLVNLDGEVVGMNTAIFSRSGGYMGIGFAIPINMVSSIARQLVEHGEVTRGFLGIVIQQLTPELAASFNMEQNQGILVSQVTDDSPAAKAGLRQGDVIVAYQGEPVKDVGEFRNRVSLTPPGNTERLTILRDGKRQTINVSIGKLTEDNQIAASGPVSTEHLGLAVQTLTPQLAQQHRLEAGAGVLVTGVEPGSVAARAGLEPGVLVLQVNQKPVNSAEEFRSEVNRGSAEKRVLLLVRRGNMQQYLVLSW